jgi:hypothetical protein
MEQTLSRPQAMGYFAYSSRRISKIKDFVKIAKAIIFNPPKGAQQIVNLIVISYLCTSLSGGVLNPQLE